MFEGVIGRELLLNAEFDAPSVSDVPADVLGKVGRLFDKVLYLRLS